ncbi:MAG: nuclear transport factor 2 family protein [Solirubrobacteraceae bacterium]
MSLDREKAAAYVESYGQSWESWDIERFVALHSEDVVYVAHPEETVVGQEALRHYVQKEKAAQGEVIVRMGKPVIDGNHVAAEFWVTASKGAEQAAIAGCLVAQLDDSDGRCTHFREYWFDLEGYRSAYEGWGE